MKFCSNLFLTLQYEQKLFVVQEFTPKLNKVYKLKNLHKATHGFYIGRYDFNFQNSSFCIICYFCASHR